MKKIYSIFILLAMAFPAFAQTPQQILERMAKVWEEHEKEGLVMTVDTKMPIVGTLSVKQYSLGNKTRTETKMLGAQLITWDDGVTEWTYTSNDKKRSISIEDSKQDPSEDSDADLFTNATDDGYDFSIKKETANSWLILCKKNKHNKEKDDPKNIEIEVSKNGYYPLSLKTKMSGITLTMREISFGVKEDFVTFDLKNYPGVKIEDKRNKK